MPNHKGNDGRPADQGRLPKNLVVIVRCRAQHDPGHTVTALRGLGRETGREVDAKQDVDGERAAWEG